MAADAPYGDSSIPSPSTSVKFKPTANAQARPASGFTLIEVLLALALFTVTAAVLAQTCSNLLYSQHTLSSAAEKDGSLIWLQRYLLRLPNRQTLEQGGRIDLPDGRRVEWEAVVEPTDTLDVLQVSLHLKINQPAVARPVHLDLRRTIYRSGWMEEHEKAPILREREQSWQQLLRDRNLPLQ